MVDEFYGACTEFVKLGWWKAEPTDLLLQHFLVYFIYHKYFDLDSAIRNVHNKFDKFLLSTLYTLNACKTSNRVLRHFSNFLNETYTTGEFFLYLSLRHTAVVVNGEEFVSSQIIRAVTRVFKEEQNPNISISCSSLS